MRQCTLRALVTKFGYLTEICVGLILPGRLLLDFCSTFAQLLLDFCSTLLGFRVSLFVTNGHVTFNPNVDLLAFILQLQDCDYKLYAYL